jgi:hypothetical protein
VLCTTCNKKPIRYIAAQQCAGCYRRAWSEAHLDRMQVRPCPGACGKRVHNMPKMVVPGIVQGHGPGMEWCYTCYRTFKPPPRVERVVKNRGLCAGSCKRPMMTGLKVDEGFVKHHAHGMCNACYMRGRPRIRRGINMGELNRAAKLQTGDVLEIRRLYKAGKRQPELAEMFGVSHQNIHSIVARKSWRHLYEPVDSY